ncbi:MAG: long-chain fatty acid--CoA ligase [bacterium]|nr:long-chain fatty acid--CoA ligase [bacterium]
MRSTSPPGSLGRPDHPALLVYTSGTTGRPKGAVLSQRSLLHTMYNAIDHERLSTDSTVLAVLPMFHVGGLNIQLTPCLFAGGTVILEERFDPARLLELLRQHRPTHLALVPAAMRSLAEATTQLGDDLSSLGALTCGSSIVPPDLIRHFAKHDISVVQVYGATETGPTAIVLDPNDADRIGSCGKPALHTELRVTASTGREVRVGEVGELRLRGPNLFVGYWEDPSSTEAAFADGWYRTGDLGFVDKDGFTYVTGRVEELIISGGENVYPAEIEQVLEQHDRIESAAVIGKPDERWGESPAAFVVTSTSPAPTEAELSAWVQTRLAGYKQPRLWIFVDELPMTSLGKVRKDELRRALEEG